MQIYVDAMTQAISQIGITAESDEDVYQSKAQAYSEQRSAALVTNLDQSTRDMLRSDLVTFMNDGLTPDEIASSLQDNYAFSEKRGKVIARTETGFSWNHGAIASYQHAGLKTVRVYDGDGDKECMEANGQTWAISYAMTHLLSHPNCVRSFAPPDDPDALPDRDENYVDQPKEKKGKKKKE